MTASSASQGRQTSLMDNLGKQFPLLRQNPDLVYLDSAATTQKPEVVLEVLDGFYRESNANVHRSLYNLAERATQALEDARKTIASFLNASSPREIIFVRGATEALNLAAWSLSELLVEEGDIILTSILEHHANFVPWQQAALRKRAQLLLVPSHPDGTLNLDFLDELCKDGRANRVKIGAMSHVSNALGTLHPVEDFARWCKERDIPLVLDAAQSAAHLPLDVQTLGVDFLAFSGHKVYGPMGSGVLWGREKWLEKMPPWQTGGEMISMVKPEKTTWNELPYKFEAGTPDVAAAAGLSAALQWMQDMGLQRLREREQALDRYAYTKLKELEGLNLYGPSDSAFRRSVFSFNLEGIHSHDVAQILDRSNVAIRSGHHCAQPAMRMLGIPSSARASLAAYNTFEDIDRLVHALKGVQEFF